MKFSIRRTERKPELTIWTTADRDYEFFLPAFFFFALKSNPNALVVVGVEDSDLVIERYRAEFTFLKRKFGSRFRVVESDFKVSIPASVRFLDFPRFETKWCYFTDVDIFITDDVAKLHIDKVTESGLAFSNVIRPGTKRLTGLHFHAVESLWPSLREGLEVRDHWAKQNDEQTLYELVEAFVSPRLSEALGHRDWRPIPGVHLSLFSRYPFKSINPLKPGEWVGWSAPESSSLPKVLSFLDSRETRKFRLISNPDTRFILAAIEVFCTAAMSNGLLPIDRIHMLSGSRAIMHKLANRLTQDLTSMKPSEFTTSDSKSRLDQLHNTVVDFRPSQDNLRLDERPAIEGLFTNIWRENSWKGTESRSGPSSGLDRTSNIRREIPPLIKKLRISSLLDVPCGDLYWMKLLLPQLPEVKYTGIDIVEGLINENRLIEVGAENLEFHHRNALEDPLPETDLVLSRDFLFHLSYHDCRKFLRNFALSRSKYLLTTSHIVDDSFVNQDIKTGGWRKIDLFSEPFCFPDPLESIKDGGGDRMLHLFSLEQVLACGLIRGGP